MPIGTPLATLRQMLNVEVGEEANEAISPARISINNRLLNNQQAFLYGQHAYIRGKTRVSLPLTVGQQFTPITTLVNGTPLNELIDFDRPETTEFINYSNFRYRLDFGIGQLNYNVYNAAYGPAGVPCMAWDIVNTQTAVADPAANYPGSVSPVLSYTVIPGGTYQWIPGLNEVSLTVNGVVYTAQDTFSVPAGVTTATATGTALGAAFTGQLNTIGPQIEMWPIPAIAQTLELAGTLPINQMEVDTDTCVIDDLLLVLFTAAEILARAGVGDAQAKAAKAKAHLDSIRSSYPFKFDTFNISGGSRWVKGFDNGRGRPVIAVMGNSH